MVLLGKLKFPEYPEQKFILILSVIFVYEGRQLHLLK